MRILRKRLKSQGRSARTSWVYCPNCRRDLNGDNESFVEDNRLVRYTCATCGFNSEWDFGAPVPLYYGVWVPHA